LQNNFITDNLMQFIKNIKEKSLKNIFYHLSLIVVILVASIFLILPICVHAAVLNASALLGQENSSNDPLWTQTTQNNAAGSINAKGFHFISSVAIDTVYHRLFVSDAGNNRILVYQLDSDNSINSNSYTAINVLGTSGGSFTTAGSGANTTSTFGGGVGVVLNIAYDNFNDRLFVSDNRHNRVMSFDVAPGFTNDEAATFVLTNGMTNADDMDYDSQNSRLFVAVLGGTSAHSVPAGSDSSINNEAPLFHLTNSCSTSAGVAYDPVNFRVFCADYNKNLVLAFSVPAGSDSSINNEAPLFFSANRICQQSPEVERKS